MIHKELTDDAIVLDRDLTHLDADLSEEEVNQMLRELGIPENEVSIGVHFSDEIPDYEGIRNLADDLLGGN